MARHTVIRLLEQPTRIRILRDHSATDFEPLALEDFSDETQFTDRVEGEPTDTSNHITPPQEEPRFTLEQVQEEVQAAYDRGFAEGQDVASAVLETELRTLTERVRSIDSFITELQHQYADAVERSERIALDLAITIARAILRYEADRSIECVLSQARAVLEQYHGKDAVAIRLNPADYHEVEAAGNPIVISSESRSITVVADPSVERGGCILDTALGQFDAQLTTQLERARSIISEQIGSHSAPLDELSNAV